MKNENKFLLIKGIGGLGNRIFCLLTGILYARLTKRRLLVDWSDSTYSKDGSNVFHQFYLCNGCDPTDEIPSTDSVWPDIWRGQLQTSAKEMLLQYVPEYYQYPEILRTEIIQKFFVNLSELNYQEDILIMWAPFTQVFKLRRHLTGEFKELRKLKTKAILKKLWQENLSLQPLIQERVDQLKSKWLHQKTCGVHVRYTDRTVRLPAIHRKLETLLKREPEIQIFLATDNVQIKLMFQARYPHVITTEKWYPPAGQAMHRNPDCPDRFQEGIDALVDMVLLTHCEYLILDETSSFAYMASVITDQPHSNIFDVQRGHRLPPQLRHWVWRFKRGLQQVFIK